jgi:hypothetical protein
MQYTWEVWKIVLIVKLGVVKLPSVMQLPQRRGLSQTETRGTYLYFHTHTK